MDLIIGIMEEIWKDIVGYEGKYQISNMGQVKSLVGGREKIIKGRVCGSGYYEVDLQKKHYTIHRLVAMSFLDNPLKCRNVDHIDRNKLNNNVDNLRWATSQQNIANTKVKNTNTSGFKGVYERITTVYVAKLRSGNTTYNLGTYNTPEEASVAYNTKAKELFGEFAHLCE